MPTKQIFPHTQSRRVFGHPFRVGLYAGGVTSRTTCLSFSMMTLSPATGTLRLGQVAGSDQFVALAGGAAGLWACTIVNALTSNDAEINDIMRIPSHENCYSELMKIVIPR